MASSLSSHEVLRGSPCQRVSPQPRRRSESRPLFTRRPPKAVGRRRDDCPGSLRVGDAVRVFSCSADEWVDAEIMKFVEEEHVRVEYEVGEYWYGKTLHVHSKHIAIPSELVDCSFEAVDPGAPSFAAWFLTALPKLTSKNHQAVNQGNHAADRSLSAEDKYVSLVALWKLIENRDVVLVKGTWLLKCYYEQAVLPCRQELPPGAWWEPEELVDKFTRVQPKPGRSIGPGQIDLVSVTHCWYSKDHPDPCGEQVQEIGPLLEARLVGRREDLAVFWCWCSYYQDRPGTARTASEQEAFDRSFPFMDLWYANRNCQVWMITKVPQNNLAYHLRGWTTWESTVAKFMAVTGGDPSYRGFQCCLHPIIKPEEKPRLLDVCKCAATHGMNWHKIEDVCSVALSELPVHPSAFCTLMKKKNFTKGEPDRNKVLKNYSANFTDVISVIPRIRACGKAFSLGECEYLKKVMLMASSLQELSLVSCSGLGVAGMQKIASSVPSCYQLKSLKFQSCDVCVDGMKMCAVAFANLASLAFNPEQCCLSFHGCLIGDIGAEILADILPVCPDLAWNLDVTKCGISRRGARALYNVCHDLHDDGKLAMNWNYEGPCDRECEKGTCFYPLSQVIHQEVKLPDESSESEEWLSQVIHEEVELPDESSADESSESEE